jgi:S-adenosyl-L-methionine hydrolase (adenosine-forming)
MAVITLTSDFGLRDGYVGAVKGVIVTIAPEATVVDIAHVLPPQDVVHGAFVLAQAAPYFPRGTVHVGIVDPGVGGTRRAICVVCNDQYYVGPDNGLFAVIAHGQHAREVYHVTNSRFFRDDVSSTFHGRDIFAPVAAHLANGVAVDTLGPRIEDPQPLQLPLITMDDESIVGEVVYIDHFGNAVTNIRGDDLETKGPITIDLDTVQLTAVAPTYDSVAVGAPLALIDSAGLLEIAVREGHAADQLDITRGSQVVVSHP